ncbi:MAG: Cytochrome c biogenesis protein transmembrane region [Candidatus Levybacteria bacterium GW2011_GWA2_40_8]|nr:MAG: Cytochrome c biogenesis protein transmembrane region [Candidatus Levybacteria bacterium GW2011_GWA2_40_8]
MEFLVSASFIAAFIAGVAALFAPCCVTVLLPTYLASVFRNRIAVFSMTFIYFLGLLVVFLPIGLGAVALTQLFSSYHNLIFSAGSIFLIFLGIILLLGIQFSLPFNVHPQLKNANIGSVFSLGVFSGIATTCCAPVLAGVLALSILPGSFLLGGAYTLAYVLGMVVPLFIIAASLDRFDFTKKFFAFRKTVGYSLFGRKIRLTASNLISGSMFLGFGVFVFYLSLTGNLVSHSSYQVSINIYLTKIIQFLSRYTSLLPEPFWALFFIGIFLLITGVAIKQFRSIRNL